MKSARVIHTGRSSHEDLADRPEPLPTYGEFKAGSQRLVAAAAKEVADAQEVYTNGVEAELDFDTIARQIQARGYKKRPLVPWNTPYFRIIRKKFLDPSAPDRIMEAFGEDRGDSNGKQLYRFPVEFISDDLNVNFIERFEAWRTSELFRWSADGADGHLKCMRHADTPDQAVRRWGTRPVMIDRNCDPNSCPIYQSEDPNKRCGHISHMYFSIPGIDVGIIQLSFPSTYAAADIPKSFELVSSPGLMGRSRGTAGNFGPLFHLTKELDVEISRFDESRGKYVRTKQNLIRLVPNFKAIGDYKRSTESGALPAPAHAPEIMSTSEYETALTAEETNGDTVVVGPKEPTPFQEPKDKGIVAGLRKDLAEVLKQLKWEPSDLLEWMAGNGYPKESVHSELPLREILDKLSPDPALSGPEGSEPEEETPF